MERFRFIDHTGDLGIEVFGHSLESLFQHAGEAFTAIVTDAEMVGSRESRQISLEADGVEDLLVRWLNEFIFLFDTQGLLFTVFDILSIDGRHVKADVRGEVYDEKRHEIKTTVKGATYHQLEVTQKEGAWKARIIFDL